MSLTHIPPPSLCMLPGWVSAFATIKVLGPVTLPTLRLADSRPVTIVAPTMSVKARWDHSGNFVRQGQNVCARSKAMSYRRYVGDALASSTR
jgi:hypothetical protein